MLGQGVTRPASSRINVRPYSFNLCARMHWNESLYLEEMRSLIETVVSRYAALPDAPVTYTISIWTDPDAAASAVSLDTFENSQAFVSDQNAWNAQMREDLLSRGDSEMAALFETQPERNCSPADFAYREFAEYAHQSFAPGWEESTEGACWDLLEPGLLRVAQEAAQALKSLRLHPAAILAVNSRQDWFDHTIELTRDNPA